MPDLATREDTDRCVIDWETCVSMCGGEEEARAVVSVCVQEVRISKEHMQSLYDRGDLAGMRRELHKARGGVCYLKLPELEETLKAFHQSVREQDAGEQQDVQKLEAPYIALLEAENRFLSISAQMGLG